MAYLTAGGARVDVVSEMFDGVEYGTWKCGCGAWRQVQGLASAQGEANSHAETCRWVA